MGYDYGARGDGTCGRVSEPVPCTFCDREATGHNANPDGSDRVPACEGCNAPEGYSLPDGWTWDEVARLRAVWGVPASMLPVASDGGIVAWGIPIPGSGLPA